MISQKQFRFSFEIAFATLATPKFRSKYEIPNQTSLFKPVNSRSKYTRNCQDLHIAASPDIWHQRMGYIRLLKLYKLGKNCLTV